MFPKGALSMKRDRLLISSAMLTSLCETQSKDNLSLIEPFVIMSVALTTQVNCLINSEKLLVKLKEDFAFADMPKAVLTKVLDRLSSRLPKENRIIKKEKDGFRLIKDLTQEKAAFESSQKNTSEEVECVVTSLEQWLNMHLPFTKVDKKSTTEYLSSFFETQGFDIVFEIEEIRTTTISASNKIDYQIGRFIIDAKDNNTSLFNKILKIVQGMMIASAIYIDTSPASDFIEKRGINGTKVFLDTTLVIYAMGYKTAEQETAAKYLVNSLYDNGADLYIFPQHVAEIKDILTAFNNRQKSKAPYRTLERLENEEWTTTEINKEIMFLEEYLNKDLGISVYTGNQYLDEKGKLHDAEGAYVDSEKLKEHINNAIPNYGRDESRLQNDVDAICSVVAQRAGMRFERIEGCLAIFVTTNYSLIKESNRFLKYSKYKQSISPIISDVDLTTIMWLKLGCSDPTVPLIHLVRHATAAVSVTDIVLEAFFRVIHNLERKGGITQDEAIYMRYDIYARKEAMAMCGGDETQISEESVYEILRRVRARYTGEAEKETALAQERLNYEQEQHRIAEESLSHENDLLADKMRRAQKFANSRNAEAQELRQKNREAKERLLDLAENEASKKADKTLGIVTTSSCVALIVITAICTYIMVLCGINSLTGVVLLVFSIVTGLSTINLFFPAFGLMKKIKPSIRIRLFDYFYDKEYKKVEPQISILTSRRINPKI